MHERFVCKLALSQQQGASEQSDNGPAMVAVKCQMQMRLCVHESSDIFGALTRCLSSFTVCGFVVDKLWCSSIQSLQSELAAGE